MVSFPGRPQDPGGLKFDPQAPLKLLGVLYSGCLPSPSFTSLLLGSPSPCLGSSAYHRGILPMIRAVNFTLQRFQGQGLLGQIVKRGNQCEGIPLPRLLLS